VPKYDVAVLGAGLGGLAVAALFSRSGKKSIVIERDGSLDDSLGILKHDGFSFMSAPTLSYGLQQGDAIHGLFSGLGPIWDLADHSPSYQVALPDRRITVYAEQERTREELGREFPDEIAVLSRFYRDIHKDAVTISKSRISAFVSRRRTAASFLRKYRFSTKLMMYFNVQSLYFFKKPIADLSFASLIMLCDTAPIRLHGGFQNMAEQLYRSLLQHGGEMYYREPDVELIPGTSRSVGIKTVHGILDAAQILVGQTAPHTTSTLCLGIREQVVPVGMCQDVLCLPDYSEPNNVMVLSLSAHQDTSAAPEGMRALTASFYSSNGSTKETAARIQAVSKIVPFLSDHLIFSLEQPARHDTLTLPVDLSLKTFFSSESSPVILRSSKHRNIFVLKERTEAPYQMLSTVVRFVQKLG